MNKERRTLKIETIAEKTVIRFVCRTSDYVGWVLMSATILGVLIWFAIEWVYAAFFIIPIMLILFWGFAAQARRKIVLDKENQSIIYSSFFKRTVKTGSAFYVEFGKYIPSSYEEEREHRFVILTAGSKEIKIKIYYEEQFLSLKEKILEFMDKQILIENLNSDYTSVRLGSLKTLIEIEKKAGDLPVIRDNDANNHIHTTYSFSPYSPAKAAYMAYRAGLLTMGIMDHDSLGGAREFVAAAKILGRKCTVGFEARVHMKGLNYGLINNPDQKDHMYIAAHGIPHQNIEAINGFLQKIRDKRNVRNRKMTDKINGRFSAFGIILDFDKDVYPLSKANEGGAITERHLMFALSKKIYDKFEGSGEKITAFIEKDLKINIGEKIKCFLSDKENQIALYDLLGVLKSDASFFYIDATDESLDAKEMIDYIKSKGAIAAYPYLGDIGDSVTGDKKAQKFEDAYLDNLFETLKALKFDAVAYMPTRNTKEQLMRVRALCQKQGFFEISGEDINSPRQKFECPKLADPLFSNLITSTYALIGHETAATKKITDGMFTDKTIKKMPELSDRIKYFSEIGKE